MHSRFPAGWRFTLWTAVLATLILLPCLTASADSPRSVMGDASGGVQAVDRRAEDGPSSPALFARSNYVWPFAVGPFYGEAERVSREAPGVVQTAVGSFDLERGELNIPEELRTTNRLSELGVQYFVIAIEQQASSAGMAKLIEQNGGAVVQWLPVSSMIARLTPSAMSAVQGSSDVIAIEPYQPAFKLSPSIGRVPLSDPAQAVSEVYALDVRIFEGENAEAVAEALAKLGGNVLSVYPDTVRVELHRSKLADVAALQPVQMVWESLQAYPQSEETTTCVQTGRWNAGAVPYHDAGIDGSGGGLAAGQVLMVLDTGIQLDNGDLSDTRTDAGTPGPTHRKVLRYEPTAAFGGGGDTSGCDYKLQGGYTHGHFVSVVALGNATAVDLSYGDPWYALDANENPWNLDGLAPGAKLVAYDAQRTPVSVTCADPFLAPLETGDLFSAPSAGSMYAAYMNDGARVFNFSWGAMDNRYTADPQDIDVFLNTYKDAMVFCSAGNYGLDEDEDGYPDEASLGTTANTKNGLAIGASRAPNDLGDGGQEDERAFFSSVGPTNLSKRIAPQLMAPGDEHFVNGDDMGLSSEFACRSNDNDQLGAVECDITSGHEGTSYSSPAAAGAALLVRDYFAQGFYPDGTAANPGNAADQVPNISGALIKAILIASADFMEASYWGNLTWDHRFNNEQGYGRIKLDNALPLQSWPASITGLAVADGGIAGGVGHLSGLDGVINADITETDSATFKVCDPDQELRVVLAWIEGSGTNLINDIDLELQSPSDVLYFGNYFTDDVVDHNRSLDPGEDCPGVLGYLGELDAAPWSLPTTGCLNAVPDTRNPTEAIMLSPDYMGDGDLDLNPDDDNQIELGDWIVRVKSKSVGSATAQRYAVAIAGGICLGSSARFGSGVYACNSRANVTINEVSEVGDETPDATTVAARTTLQVLDPSDVVVDSEPGSALGLTQPDPAALKFVIEGVILTDGTAYDPGNGVLDVRDGDRVRVVYQDVDGAGLPDPNKQRISTSQVKCDPSITSGNIVFFDYGQDVSYQVTGGCERNALGQFDYGYPDKYMDADELITYSFAFGSAEDEDMVGVEVNLRCVVADEDSPAECPRSISCTDPDRLNNATCDGTGDAEDPVYMTILDTPKTIGLLPSGAAIAPNFAIAMEPDSAFELTPRPEIELILEVTSATSGKTTTALAINRHPLDVDEDTLWYSTDYPTGGTEVRDHQNNEVADDPWSTLADWWILHYRFDTRTWSDLTAGGTKNTGLQSPWNFDQNDGGFTVGLNAITDEAAITATIAQWGEDKNFNGLLDGECSGNRAIPCYNDADCLPYSAGPCDLTVEDRDPENGLLDSGWGLGGGCGWQTKEAAAPTGGIWHTGLIYGTSGTCLVPTGSVGQCQGYESVPGSSGQLLWVESLLTPVMQKVNGDDYTIEIVDWTWNQAIDLADEFADFAWELDNDIFKLEPVDLTSDGLFTNVGGGGYGAVSNVNNASLTNGFSVFAPVSGTCALGTNSCKDNEDCTMLCSDGETSCQAHNCRGPNPTCDLCSNPQDDLGKLGRSRTPRNSCYFVGPEGIAPAAMGTLGLPRPADDDIDNDSDGFIDEYVELTGPIRNMSVYAFNGPDMRWSTLEDFYGDTGEYFQAGVTLINSEKGSAQDPDPAMSYGLGVDDMVIQWKEYTLIDDTRDCVTGGECAVLDVATSNMYEGSSLLEVTVLEKSPPLANDCDWDGTDDGTDDCDSDGMRDLVVKAQSDNEVAGEIMFVNAVAPGATEYKGSLPISSVFNAEGVLFIQPQGSDDPWVQVLYMDLDDGSGLPCKLSPDPAAWGRVTGGTFVFLARGQVTVKKALLSDNGDNDSWADSNETVTMRIELLNTRTTDLTGIGLRLLTNDPRIECITNPQIEFGDLGAQQSRLSDQSFEFKVGDIQRSGYCASGGTPCLVDDECAVDDYCDAYLQDYAVTFNILIKSNEFDATLNPQTLVIDLDLDASGGTSPGVFFESFESGTWEQCSMAIDNMDENLYGEEQSEGYRCQYSDPDWEMSNSYQQITDCWVGATDAQARDVWWQIVDGTGTGKDARSFTGQYSAWMGRIDDLTLEPTTPMATLEALSTITPMNIGASKICSVTRTTPCSDNTDCPAEEECVSPSPELSFKYQVSLADYRCVNTTGPIRSADGGAVQFIFVTPDNEEIGVWQKLQPYMNVYDAQKEDNYYNCFFDPIDDGNTEDDFFDPTDPERRLGPSTMCYPEFSYCNVGQTTGAYSPGAVGNGDPGTGLQGAYGPGTWVESKLNLDRFLGRRIKLRFINSSIKNETYETMEAMFGWNPEPCDDGWWVDDIMVTDALLGEPAVLSADVKDNSGLPPCGAACAEVTAYLDAEPPTALAAPGQVVELTAFRSVADRCPGGTLQYRYWIEGTPDELVRSWTDNPVLLQAPLATTTYKVDVRCSSLWTCADSASLEVVVNCPASGNLGGDFPTITAPNLTTLQWDTSLSYNFGQGLLSTLNDTYPTIATGTDQPAATTHDISGTPPAADGWWWLFRGAGGGGTYCNEISSYGSAARDAALP